MTNAKVYRGFLDDKKVEEHCPSVELCVTAAVPMVIGSNFTLPGSLF